MLGQGILAGKKTYVTAVVAIISTVAAYLVGDVQLTDAAQLILTSILGITIRSGIASNAKTDGQ